MASCTRFTPTAPGQPSRKQYNSYSSSTNISKVPAGCTAASPQHQQLLSTTVKYQQQQQSCNAGKCKIILSVLFFAKEGADCNLKPVKEGMLEPVTLTFQKGLAQLFKKPSGTGIDLSTLEEAELLNSGSDLEVYLLAVKAEASPLDCSGSEEGNPKD
ncbi:probable E3 ubiquitin-protein ligase LOG2 [Papaver somniferum]|uniref:probable E3 ubiquitin-protein ligase LOG2 n=1 Tax=Papaver somniferum TaxID=3469 RepID=UPI000E705436|nr:probable E3 ubiquitin-protein ligase LOG2 [Papaver somniferum]